MKIDGWMAYILIFVFMILISNQSFAYFEYEPNAKNGKITIDLNVIFNINGAKQKEKVSGNLSLKGLFMNDIVFYDMKRNRDIIFTITISFSSRIN